MKKRLILLTLLSLLMGAYNNKAFAQVNLQVDSLINFPDTAIIGQAYPVAIRVKNLGPQPFQGPLQIGLQRDSAFTYLYYNQNPAVTILPNDTLTFYTTNGGVSGFVIDSAVFRPGNNVVVVWPYTSQTSMIVGSLTTSVYVNYPTSIKSVLNNATIFISPNPFKDIISVTGTNNKDFEHVRIFTMQGVIVYDKNLTGNEIMLEQLPKGFYLLDAETRDGKHLYKKIVKD